MKRQQTPLATGYFVPGECNRFARHKEEHG